MKHNFKHPSIITIFPHLTPWHVCMWKDTSGFCLFLQLLCSFSDVLWITDGETLAYELCTCPPTPHLHTCVSAKSDNCSGF